MNHIVKRFVILTAIIAVFTLSGCVGEPATPSDTAIPTPTPTESYAYEPEPSASPVALPASYYSTTDAIPPETELTIFNYGLPEDGTNTENDPYNVEFTGKTDADLNGDGDPDDIEILPGALNAKGTEDYKLYDSITVKVNGSSITVKAPEGRTIGTAEENLYANIVDTDKNDGNKEIVIDDSNPAYPTSCMLTYDGKNITLIPWQNDIIQANGTGYIYVYEWIGAGKLAQPDGMGVLKLKKLSADRTKWEDVKVKYYRTVSTYLPPIDEYADSAEAQSDQMLAKQPGGKEEVQVKQGTEVFLGFFDPAGWIQVIKRDGTILGWLDCTKVDWDQFTDFVYVPDLG